MSVTPEEPCEYELAFGGRTRQVITLRDGRLHRRMEHGLGKAHDLAVADLIGFTVHVHRFSASTPRGAVVVGSQKLLGFDGQLLVAWRDGDERRKASWSCNSRAPELQRLLARLAELAPAADLRGLAINEARRRMGMWTTTALALAFIAAVTIPIAVYAAYVLLTAG